MVTSLPPPPHCSLQLVDDIIAERQNGINREFFNSIRDRWRERVEEYLKGLTQITSLNTF